MLSGIRPTKAYLVKHRLINADINAVMVLGNAKGRLGVLQRADKVGHDTLPILPRDIEVYADSGRNEKGMSSEAGLEESAALCKKLKSIFRKRNSRGDPVEKLINITFKELVCSPLGNDVEQLSLKIKGKILRDIWEDCKADGEDIYVDFELVNPFTSLKHNSDGQFNSELFKAEMKDMDKDFSVRGMPITVFKGIAFCEGVIILPATWKLVWLATNPFDKHRCRSLFNIIISVKQREAVNERSLNFRAEIPGRLYEQETCADVQVICRGTVVAKCHRSILAAQSLVFKEMLVSSETKELHLVEMTMISAKALIQFLYHRGVEERLKGMQVAFQLLRAGERYVIPSLVEKMIAILIRNQINWYRETFPYCTPLFPLQEQKAPCRCSSKMRPDLPKLKSKDAIACPAYKKLTSKKNLKK